jgi:peptidoglycan/xylan/chitin deacetylase (PgdA/CDA1 family)
MKKFILLSLIILFISGNEHLLTDNTTTNILIENQDHSAVIENNNILEASFNISEENAIFNTYLPILMFHYIKNIPSNSPDQLGYRLSFSPEMLEQFLIYFKENNIETLTFWDLKHIIEGKKALPEKAVILSFDDGYIDHYQNAFRILKQYNMKGVFFIISNKPDNDENYANWEQIKEMADDGQEIASHTVNHFDLSTLSEEKIRNELEISKKIIEEKISKPVISFCYPAGKYDNRVIKIAKENYIFARTTNPGKHYSLAESYEIPTVRIYPTTSTSSLKTWFE